MDAESRFTALYQAHYGRVLAYARRRVDEETARDVTAETFAVAWRRLEEPTVSSTLSLASAQLPWLYATARRVLANQLRRDHHRHHLDLTALAAAAAGVPVLTDPAAGVVERDAVLRALARLTPRDQEVLQLSTWEELDPTTGAAVLGCSPTAFKVRLHRARRRLQVALQRDDELDHRSGARVHDVQPRASRPVVPPGPATVSGGPDRRTSRSTTTQEPQ